MRTLTNEENIRPTIRAVFDIPSIFDVFPRVELPYLQDVDVEDGDDAGCASVFEKVDSFRVTKGQNEEDRRNNRSKRTVGVEDVTEILVVVPEETVVLVA